MKYDEMDCRMFYTVARRRMLSGYSEEAIFAGKPRGFSIWLKKHYKEAGPVNIVKRKKQEYTKYTCWKCGNIYKASRCAVCGAFKPRN